MRHKRVSPEEFVLAWQQASTLPSLADALGMTEHAAEVRAYRYRAAGVQLRDLRSSYRLDVVGLNRIAAGTK